jgi:polysaccharide pyruvyl transferase WcaK-like protein
MKILHVASFGGNIGDIANHHGFRLWFEKLISDEIEWNEFEIRNVYRGTERFDDQFVALANASDLVVFGGGNFFELWVENSPTGTSISIESEVFNKIKTPIFFNALGVDDGMGYSASTIDRFNAFFEKLAQEPTRYLVSVRNDGAFSTLSKHVKNKNNLAKVVKIPDGGFFTKLPQTSPSKKENGLTVGINLAGDMLDVRFPGKEYHDYNSFLQEFRNLIQEISEQWSNTKFILFPHIYSDIKIFSDLLFMLPDDIRRNDLIVAKYDSNCAFEESSFMEYAKCDIFLASRFHSNVVALGNNIPTIGLNSYKQIQGLYDEINMSKYLVNVKERTFSKKIIGLITEMTESDKLASEISNAKLNIEKSLDQAISEISAWLQTNHIHIQNPDNFKS